MITCLSLLFLALTQTPPDQPPPAAAPPCTPSDLNIPGIVCQGHVDDVVSIHYGKDGNNIRFCADGVGQGWIALGSGTGMNEKSFALVGDGNEVKVVEFEGYDIKDSSMSLGNPETSVVDGRRRVCGSFPPDKLSTAFIYGVGKGAIQAGKIHTRYNVVEIKMEGLQEPPPSPPGPPPTYTKSSAARTK